MLCRLSILMSLSNLSTWIELNIIHILSYTFLSRGNCPKNNYCAFHLNKYLDGLTRRLDAPWKGVLPGRSHLVRELGVVLLELCWRFSKQNNNCIDSRSNGSQENCAKDKANNEANSEDHSKKEWLDRAVLWAMQT